MNSLKLYTMVGIGGMIGAVCRYEISVVFHMLTVANGFPLATLLTNLLGCFVLSYLLYHRHIKTKIHSDYLAALTVGVLGAFTTFSTVTVEAINLWINHLVLAITYVGISVIGGLICCYTGYKLATREVHK